MSQLTVFVKPWEIKGAPDRRIPNLSDSGREDLCEMCTSQCKTGLYDGNYKGCQVYLATRELLNKLERLN